MRSAYADALEAVETVTYVAPADLKHDERKLSRVREELEAATGIRPALPDRYADLMTRPERFAVIDNDLGAVEAAVRATFGAA